jgi:hypothetical protein
VLVNSFMELIATKPYKKVGSCQPSYIKFYTMSTLEISQVFFTRILFILDFS